MLCPCFVFESCIIVTVLINEYTRHINYFSNSFTRGNLFLFLKASYNNSYQLSTEEETLIMYKCNNPVNWHWSKWVFRSYLIYNICTFMQLLALMNFHLTITIWGEEKTDLSFYTVTMSRILDQFLLSYLLNEMYWFRTLE